MDLPTPPLAFTDAMIQQLALTGVSICPHFLSPALLRDTQADFDRVRAAGSGAEGQALFKRAGTGQHQRHTAQNDQRRDETYWLDRADTNPTRTALWQSIDALQLALNRTLFLGLVDFEGHYAAYPPGGFYRRHLDSFRDPNHHGSGAHQRVRIVSFVLYLNRAWRSQDGGQLRIYESDGSFQDVDPVGGKLVCFLSGEKEHEVLTSHAERFSLTGWFRASGG